MQYWMIILCVIPGIVETITITSNGNSPETKMRESMMKEETKHFLSTPEVTGNLKNKYQTVREPTKLSINERYRRLIPYMTFYYANDLATTTTESYNERSIEVEKAEIVEAGTLRPHEREPKIRYIPRHNNIPVYQGNRLTQYNIASSNPSKLYYKSISPVQFQYVPKISQNYNPVILDTFENNGRVMYERFTPKPFKSSNVQYVTPRKPYFNIYQNENIANVQYYSSEKEKSPIYKLVPYEQAPPVKVVQEVQSITSAKKPHAVSDASKNEVYVPIRQNQHEYINEPIYSHHPPDNIRKPPTIVSEVYYEKQPQSEPIHSVVLETGFKPIVGPFVQPTETTQYNHDINTFSTKLNNQQKLTDINSHSIDYKDNTNVPPYETERLVLYDSTNKATLSDIIHSLQLNKSIPKQITKENFSSSINTLLQVLNVIKAQQSDTKSSNLHSAKFETVHTTVSPTTEAEIEFQEEPYLAPVNTPSQHLDEIPSGGSSSQRFPLPISSDDEGGTPGRPGVDYPILTVIPPTKFNCKSQRYKGFFADPETRCQVWHYCDLNGGQASFLCPNGTIFSQAGLTCDWWFNVKCASTTQLYVLNESLYKFILPHSPKFPEDYSGPLVDKYLTLKFKEMEEQFRKNKKKQSEGENIDDSNEGSEETDGKDSTETENAETRHEGAVNEADVTIESAGRSGNVQRLQDD